MKILLAFLFLISSQIIFAQTLDIKITNIKNKTGSLRLAVYKDAAGFDNDKPVLKYSYAKTNISAKGELSITLKLDEGTYGIALLDDENNNKKMDYNFLGIPKEGFGFSDFNLTGMSRPKFIDFDFVLKKETKKITIKLRYM